MKPKFILFAFLLSSVEAPYLLADEPKGEKSSPVKVSVYLVSSYICRGSLATTSPAPNLQPDLAFIRGNFETGVWGSTDFIGSFKEVDPYIFLTLSHLKFGFTDFNWNFTNASYFNYKNSKTDHRIEGTIAYTGTKAFPLKATHAINPSASYSKKDNIHLVVGLTF
jgi:hypothetical protein